MKGLRVNGMCMRALSFLLGSLFIGFIWLYITFLIPVGKVNDDVILMYEVMQRINLDNAVKGIAKDKAFDAAMKEIGVAVSDAEIEKEFTAMTVSYGGLDELKAILTDTPSNIHILKNSIKKGILKQKAIENFVKSITNSDDDLALFFNERYEEYNNEFIQNEEQIIRDFMMVKGADKYEEFIKRCEDDIVIKIY